MINRRKHLLSCSIIAVIFALVFVSGHFNVYVDASETGNTGTTLEAEEIPVTSIQLQDMEMLAGESKFIDPIIEPKNYTQEITWSSSDECVAEVYYGGMIHAYEAGTCVITAQAGDITATMTVTVTAVPITSIQLQDMTMEVGTWEYADAIIEPAGYTQNIRWISSNTDVVVVYSNGELYANEIGTCVITAKAGDIVTSMTVNVTGVAVDSMELSDMDMHVGERKIIEPVIEPSNYGQKIQWSSSNDKVATVFSDGEVFAYAPGTCVITAKAGDITATMTVTVTEIPVTSITFPVTEITLEVGDDYKLEPVVGPANNTNWSYDYSSSDENIAAVYNYSEWGQDYRIKAEDVGTCVITARAGDVTATVHVTVTGVEVSSIQLPSTEITVGKGESVELVPIVEPADHKQSIRWSSSNEDIAYVNDYDNRIYAREMGTCVITARAGGASASVHVTVTGAEINAIRLQDMKLLLGEYKYIEPVIEPADSTQRIKWTSSNPNVASVWSDGEVYADGIGTCVITAESGNIKQTMQVTVSLPMERVINAGTKEELKVYPSRRNNQKLWKYTSYGSEKIVLHFSQYSYLQDSLVFFDANLKRIEKLIFGDELSNRTVTIPGDTVYIYLYGECSWTDYYIDSIKNQNGEIEAAHNKHKGVAVKAIAATCTQAGRKAYWKCEECGKLFSDAACTVEITKASLTIPATGHTPTAVAVIPATTAADGKTAGTKCSACGKLLSGCQTIPKIAGIKLAKTAYTWDGKTKTPAVSVTTAGGAAIPATYYTVAKPSGRKNVGKYTYKIAFKGYYKGTATLSFIINPKGTTQYSPAALTKGFTAKWKKQATKMSSSTITGYQIRYATNSKMISAKIKTVSGFRKTNNSITKLKAKKKYYIQIRTYKTVNKVNYYSAWSASKAVTTK